tara:strand:- start:408 stop:1607 length:1200 start_codon:yes stop_codon:yes gene_type:complete
MSLRAFTKGFATTAGPSFIRSWEAGSEKKETRRREEREDRIRQEGIDREDRLLKDERDYQSGIRDTQYEREDKASVKVDLQAAANESPEAVEKAYGILSPEMQNEFKHIFPQLLSRAKRAVQKREEGTRKTAAEVDLKEAQLATAQREQRITDGIDQIAGGVIQDKNGSNAAWNMLYTASGQENPNWTEVGRYARQIDTFTGNSYATEYLNNAKEEHRVSNVIAGLTRNNDWSPAEIRRYASTIPPGRNRNFLLSVAQGRDRDLDVADVEAQVGALYSAHLQTTDFLNLTPEAQASIINESRNELLKGKVRGRNQSAIASVISGVLRGVRPSSGSESKSGSLYRTVIDTLDAQGIVPSRRESQEIRTLIISHLRGDRTEDSNEPLLTGPVPYLPQKQGS